MTASSSSRDLSAARLMRFSSIGLPLGGVLVAVPVYLPAHLAGGLGVSMTVIGASWAAVRLIDLFVDPALGLMMDRTTTRLGRYRPWVFLGAPILMASLWALFQAREGVGSAYLIMWLLALYLGQSMLTMGHSAWAANLAPDYDGRSRTFGMIGIATVVGGVTVLLVPVLAPTIGVAPEHVVQAMGWFLIGVTPCAVGLAALKTREPLSPTPAPAFNPADILALLVKPDLLRLFLSQLCLTLGPGWMSALYLFYFTTSRGFTTAEASSLLLAYVMAGVPGAWQISRWAVRVGKHRALMISATGWVLGIGVIPFAPPGSLLATTPLMIWTGFMAAGFDISIRAMLADVADEVRLERDRDQLSLIYALNALANKLAAAFAIGLTFPLLATIGFNPTDLARNTPTAIRGLEIAFIAGPMFFVLLGGLCVAGWRLNAARHFEVRRRLDERYAQSETAPHPSAISGREVIGPQV